MTRYSETVMDHFQDPRNQGKLDHPDLIGVAGVPGCGRYVILQLALSESRDRVIAARFQSHGCGSTIASASMLTELVTGMALTLCRDLSAEDLLTALGGLPADKMNCAEFAIVALQHALTPLSF